jgi:hypothetical protein
MFTLRRDQMTTAFIPHHATNSEQLIKIPSLSDWISFLFFYFVDSKRATEREEQPVWTACLALWQTSYSFFFSTLNPKKNPFSLVSSFVISYPHALTPS